MERLADPKTGMPQTKFKYVSVSFTNLQHDEELADHFLVVCSDDSIHACKASTRYRCEQKTNSRSGTHYFPGLPTTVSAKGKLADEVAQRSYIWRRCGGGWGGGNVKWGCQPQRARWPHLVRRHRRTFNQTHTHTPSPKGRVHVRVVFRPLGS